MSTVSELVTIVRTLTEKTATDIYADADFIKQINRVNGEIWRRARWPWTYATTTITLVADTSTYALPSGSRWVDTVRELDSTRNVLLRGRSDEPDDWPTRSGTPYEYRVSYNGTSGLNELVVWPTPAVAGSLKVSYVKAPTTLTSSDTPAFPAEFHDALAFGAAARILTEEVDISGRIQQYQAEYQALVEDMRKNSLRPNIRPFVIGSRRRAGKFHG